MAVKNPKKIAKRKNKHTTYRLSDEVMRLIALAVEASKMTRTQIVEQCVEQYLRYVAAERMAVVMLMADEEALKKFQDAWRAVGYLEPKMKTVQKPDTASPKKTKAQKQSPMVSVAGFNSGKQ